LCPAKEVRDREAKSSCNEIFGGHMKANHSTLILMIYPAASNGVSIGIFIIAPRGGKLNLYPPQEGLSASGGLKSRKEK
jgi:hypothetical protein